MYFCIKKPHDIIIMKHVENKTPVINKHSKPLNLPTTQAQAIHMKFPFSRAMEGPLHHVEHSWPCMDTASI